MRDFQDVFTKEGVLDDKYPQLEEGLLFIKMTTIYKKEHPEVKKLEDDEVSKKSIGDYKSGQTLQSDKTPTQIVSFDEGDIDSSLTYVTIKSIGKECVPHMCLYQYH